MVIYKITNLKNGKIYIGQTVAKLKERWRLHRFCANHPEKYANTRLSRAIRKHGSENFTIEEIEKCTSRDELNEREVYWIKILNCVEKGYNVLHGGKSSLHSSESKGKISRANKGRVFTKEWKQKLSDSKKGITKGPTGMKMPNHVKQALLKANKGRELSISHKEKISKKLSEIRINDNNPFFNKKHSEETKLKMSEKRQGRKPNLKIPEIEYENIKDLLLKKVTMNIIAKEYNVSQATISNIKRKLIDASWIKLREEKTNV